MLLAQFEEALATLVTMFWFVLRTYVAQAMCALLLLVCYDSPEMPDTHPPCHQSLSASVVSPSSLHSRLYRSTVGSEVMMSHG